MGSLIKVVVSFVITGIGVIFVALAIAGILGIAIGGILNSFVPGLGDELLGWGTTFLVILAVGGIVTIIVGLYLLAK